MIISATSESHRHRQLNGKREKWVSNGARAGIEVQYEGEIVRVEVDRVVDARFQALWDAFLAGLANTGHRPCLGTFMETLAYFCKVLVRILARPSSVRGRPKLGKSSC